MVILIVIIVIVLPDEVAEEGRGVGDVDGVLHDLGYNVI